MIPSSFANLSATLLMMPLMSPSIVLVTFCLMPLRNEPIDVAVGVELEDVVVGDALSIRLWPSVDVLSCGKVRYEFN